MRVYEISKQLGITNKTVLDFLAKEGFEIVSHMAVLPQDALDRITVHFKAKKDPEIKKIIETSTKQPALDKPVVQHKESVMQQTKQSAPQHKMIPEYQRSYGAKQGAILEKKVIESIVVEPMSVAQAAEKFGKSVTDLILTLLKLGHVCTKNQLLSEKHIEKLALQYQIKTIRPQITQEVATKIGTNAQHGTLRLPVVVVIGHVDHGKTTLLDFIRKTKVADREKGGITQHLGAYQVMLKQGGMVFLDTPGHAAFSKIRGRGVKVADIAILVIAADDGIMPQTIEAIKHARDVNVPIIVAMNKIDKATPIQIEAVKRGLAQQDLLPEEWGGQTIVVPVSAKLGQGIDQLLEMITLQAQMMDLKADLDKPASGFVLESKLVKGLGPVATIICHEGILKLGDYFVSGKTQGKIISIVNSSGKRLQEAAPSLPVQISGFDELPDAGDLFEVIKAQQYRAAKGTDKQALPAKKTFNPDSIAIIVKTDTHSSKEALINSIDKLSHTSPKEFYIVHAAIGDINESDIMLASETRSSIYGMHVKLENNAAALAQEKGVVIHLFDIIYKFLDNLDQLAQKEKPIKMVATKIGQAVVRKVFDIKNLGVIAGSYIKEGRFAREGRVVIWRGKKKIGEGKIKSLERDRKTVKEVHTGFECAFLIDGFNDWQIDDVADCYIDIVAP